MSTRAWDQVRTFALSLPCAIEDFPWDELVIKIDYPSRRRNGLVQGPMFLWLSGRDAPTPTASLKLTASYDLAAAIGGATPTTMSGLGQWGWLTVSLTAVDLDSVRDWVAESYRNVAPKRLLAKLDGR